jgi:hypothetical protein
MMTSTNSSQKKPKKAKVSQPSGPKVKATTTGRSSGHPNYQTDKLLDVIGAIKPLGSEGWKAVGKQYRIHSGEQFERDHNDLKNKFKKLHNYGGGKPTGTPTMIASQQRARDIFREILRKDGCTTAEKTGSDIEEDGFDEDEEEYVDDNFAGEDDNSYSEQLNDSFESTRDNDEEDGLHLDDQINVVDETEAQDSGLPPSGKARKTATSSVVSSNSSAVKTKNSRPSGPSKQSGRGTVASAMNSMVEVMRDSQMFRQQQELNRQQNEMMRLMLEQQQKAAAEERVAHRQEMRALQLQVANLVQNMSSSSSSGRPPLPPVPRGAASAFMEDPEATQWPLN